MLREIKVLHYKLISREYRLNISFRLISLLIIVNSLCLIRVRPWEDVARHRVPGDDHAGGCVFLLRMRLGLENAAAKQLLRDTVDDSRYVANLLIDADSLLAMDNYVREVRR